MNSLPVAKKGLGQHWLQDEASLQAMIDAGNVRFGDTVLEIGPGTGTLTDKLINTKANIVSLEFDTHRYHDLLKKYQKTSNIKILSGDIRHFNLTSLPVDYKIVANIPYYLTAYLLRLLADTPNKPKMAVLLVQKEVAERVCARPGSMSKVAVFAQIFYKTNLGDKVSASLFTPPPKVDSQILVLHRHTQPFAGNVNYFSKVVSAGFSQKRKKLDKNLADGLNINKQQILNVLKEQGISANARAQELTLEQWQKLVKIL